MKKVNGYSIEDYLTCIITLCLSYLNPKRGMVTDSRFFKESSLKDKAYYILKPLMFSFEEGKEWAKQTIDKPWDFTLFQKKPFFTMDGKATYQRA